MRNRAVLKPINRVPDWCRRLIIYDIRPKIREILQQQAGPCGGSCRHCQRSSPAGL